MMVRYSKSYGKSPENDRPATNKRRGNARKCSWTSPRYVNYHFGKSRWGTSTEIRGKGLEVITLDTKTNTITRTSCEAFLISHTDPEAMRATIVQKLGIDVDLAGLESLVRGGFLVESKVQEAKELLKTYGITA